MTTRDNLSWWAAIGGEKDKRTDDAGRPRWTDGLLRGDALLPAGRKLVPMRLLSVLVSLIPWAAAQSGVRD